MKELNILDSKFKFCMFCKGYINLEKPYLNLQLCSRRTRKEWSIIEQKEVTLPATKFKSLKRLHLNCWEDMVKNQLKRGK